DAAVLELDEEVAETVGEPEGEFGRKQPDPTGQQRAPVESVGVQRVVGQLEHRLWNPSRHLECGAPGWRVNSSKLIAARWASFADLEELAGRRRGEPEKSGQVPRDLVGAVESARTASAGPASVFPIARLDLSDDRGDGRGVEVGSLHERRGPGDVVSVDRVEELFDLSNG